jgi:lipoate-protein ligase A
MTPSPAASHNPVRGDLIPPTRLEILPFLLADGSTQMGWDDALLDHSSQHPETAWLRTYGWSEPTLSLGYFQTSGAIPKPLMSLPIVRRPTGGGAILHAHEITYALILPRSLPSTETASSLYKLIHGAMARWIAELGLPAQLRGASQSGQKPFLCFADCDPDDVVVPDPVTAASVKVVGSAQRRRHGAVLMHGSILIEHAEQVPELRGLRDLQPELTRSLSHWSAAVLETITPALRLPFHAWEEAPSDLEANALERARSVYRDPRWTHRR